MYNCQSNIFYFIAHAREALELAKSQESTNQLKHKEEIKVSLGEYGEFPRSDVTGIEYNKSGSSYNYYFCCGENPSYHSGVFELQTNHLLEDKLWQDYEK